MRPTFTVFKDAAGKYRFNLKSSNGEIIATSEGYKAKQSCFDTINVIRLVAISANLHDETLTSDET